MKNNKENKMKNKNETNDCTCEKCGGTAPAVLHTEKPETEFKNHVGDGPSGFDLWHDTKWCC